MKKALLKLGFLFTLFINSSVNGQEASTLGKTFWLTFLETIGNPETPHEMKVVISCNKATSGTIKNFISNETRNFSIGSGGGIDTVLISTNMGYVTGSESGSSRYKGLLLQSNDTVSVSAQNTKPASCDVALIYPIEALGVDYRILTFPGDIYNGGSSTANYRSSFGIVATENNTVIDITPTTATNGGGSANSTFQITLQKGETYQVKASTKTGDLSGTLIQAKDCKKIAVFGSSTRSVILHSTCSGGFGINSADHLFEQMMPINLWGKKFAMIPTTWQPNTLRKVELVKFTSSVNATVVRFNGRTKVLSNAGMTDTFYIQTNQNVKEAIIVASKPIAICQYGLSQRCDGNTSDTDPMMMWLTPMEQTLKKLNFSCEQADQIDKFFVNLIVKTQYKNTLKIDGSAPTASWKLITNDTSYSYIQQSGLTPGNHNVECPFGFSGTLYAYGAYGSYGFNVGSSIKTLSIAMKVAGKLSNELELDTPYYNLCQYQTISFDGSSDITPNSWKWVFSDGVTSSKKSFTRTFNDTGFITVNLITIRNANGTCNGSSTINDTNTQRIYVFGKPKIKLRSDTTICLGNTVKITSTTDGDTNYVFSPATWLSCTNCFSPITKPLKDTTYYVTATTKGCSPSRDTLKIFVRDSFFLNTSNDTTICRGTSTTLSATSKGGLTSNHIITWDHGLGFGNNKIVNPKVTTTYMAILTDNCTRNSAGDFYADTNYIVVTVKDSLKITMPNDTVVCEGNDVTLNVSVDGGDVPNRIVNWDNSLGAGLSKTVTMNTTKTFKAVLSDGCTVPKDSGYVTVTVRPSIKIDTIIHPTPVCKNTIFNVTAKASGGDSTGYKFYLYDNTISSQFIKIDSFKNSSTANFNVKIKDDSRFVISLNQKCNGQTVSKKFAVLQKTGLSVSVPTAVDTICTGQFFNLVSNGVSADSKPIKFVLKEKTGANTYKPLDSNIHASQWTFVLSPTKTLTDYLIVADDNCSRTDSTTYRLMVRAPLTMSKPADALLCRGESFTASVTPAGGKVQSYVYTWKDKLNNTTLGSSNTLSIVPTTNMTVTVDLTDNCSAPLNDSASVLISPIVTDSTLVTNLAGCEPFSTEFFFPLTQPITYRNTPFTWRWYFDGNNFSNSNAVGGQTFPNIPKNYSNSGVYTAKVEMVLANGKICKTFNASVEAYQQAIADFDYLPKQIDIVDPLVKFTNLSTGSTIHTWNFGDTLDNVIVDNPSHSYKDTGLFTVMLIADNINGCKDTTYQALRILDIFRIFIPEAFSPNKDQFNQIWAPHLTSFRTIEVEIFNRWGEKVFESKDPNLQWNGNYGTSDEPCQEGVYYYRLKVRDNRKKWHYYNGTMTLLR